MQLNSNIIRRCIRYWRDERHRNLDRKCLLAISMSTHLAARFDLRGALSTWRKNARLSGLERKFVYAKTKIIAQNSVANWRRKTKNRNTARQFVTFSILRRGLAKWSNQLERKEDLKIAPQLEIARTFYAKSSLAKAVVQWQCSVLEEKSMRGLIGTAEIFFKTTQTTKTLTAWRARLHHQTYKNELIDISTTFRANILKSKVCYFIWRESARRHELRDKGELADDFNNTQVRCMAHI